MPLHGARAAALLAWVNSTKVWTDPLNDLSQLQDCSVFIRIINKIARSEQGSAWGSFSAALKAAWLCGVPQPHCKHKSTAENLVSAQELLEGEELALAKVAVLLLYHTSMSCKSPGDWNEFDYKTQVELASILKFVLDNEESLNENLEMFLQRKAPLSSSSASSSSSEEHSPLLSLPHKREVRFLELQKIASSSGANNMLSGPPSSPMGDVMQTPQFQLRRLKKQLAVERENRDELEVELAENRKLITEKDAQITMMQQRIDRLALLNEKQAADQREPREVEELREKNESLMVRLHEALRQCQDLKTEKGQMDRKINQLSEENGDLSFKLREIASHLVQLQEALNELSEEHNAAMTQSQEKQGQLESDLHAALQEKKCSEEKIEILQGKISLLEDQLAKLGDCGAQEKGEVMGDVLKLEELKQEVSSLAAKGAELQATVLRLEEEKQQREAALQSERGRFEEEKRQREMEVEVEVKKLSGEVTLLSSRLEETLRQHQRDLACQEEEAKRLRQEVERAKGDCAAERARKAELEAQLQNSLNEQRVERSVHREELARSREMVEEKEGKLEELRQKNISQGEELRDLQKTVSKLKGELASAEAAKERVPKVDNELQGFSEAARSRDAEGHSVKATCSKEMSLKSLEEKTRHREQESGSSQDLYQEKLKETQALRLQVEELEQKCREQQEAMAVLERAAAEGAMAEQAELEASRREVAQQKEKVLELQKLLEASRSVQALHDGTVEALRKELQEKGRELTQSKTAMAAAEKDLASLRSVVQEKGRSEESWKEQVSQCVQEMERKNSLIGSLEHEVSILHRQVTEKEGERKELKPLIVAESEKTKKLEERLRVLQTEMATAASRAAERCSLMKVEVQRCQEEMEKQRLAIEALKRDRHCQSEREDELRQEVKVCQDKCLQKEQLLAALQQELGSAQALAGSCHRANRAVLFQVEELNKKLTQHEKATRTQQQRVKVLEGELQAEAQEKGAELQAQLAQKEQAAEHYKGQMEKAKTHYDAKKQQNQDLAEKLKAMEHLQKENAELRTESERLAKELQQSVLQAKESELSCRNLTSQVRSLEAQVEFANQQLRDLGKFQVATDTLKSRETFRQNPADLSADSLDLSLDEAQPLNSTRKAGRSQSEASAVPPGSEESLASQRLPRKVESLESLYFTPIPSRTRSQLESSAGSLGDLSLDSGCKTRSGRRRTTINITMTKKQAKTEEPDSANVSFYSIPAAQPPNAAPGKTRLRSAASTRSLTSFSSQESLVKLETSSPQETPGNSALLGLPGSRPVTRSSLRRVQGGSSSSLGRSSIYLGTCQDEPEQLDDWNRIAELQQRNRACPPHLKTCYPLESR
ncbi:PREDICTED: nuclear mitotic apparatus protein 1, partial [Charadrius vociferus]|uniref:nuclear mitotic apparatus protein 1 n=1 Tax=Charadrius vociferus TaxID=50402 RepID=UPI0005213C91